MIHNSPGCFNKTECLLRQSAVCKSWWCTLPPLSFTMVSQRMVYLFRWLSEHSPSRRLAVSCADWAVQIELFAVDSAPMSSKPITVLLQQLYYFSCNRGSHASVEDSVWHGLRTSDRRPIFSGFHTCTRRDVSDDPRSRNGGGKRYTPRYTARNKRKN